MSTNCIKFLVIAVKLMLGLLEKHMVMKLPANLMSVKLVQLEKQGRKISTKNVKEEVQSVENACILTLVQSKELASIKGESFGESCFWALVVDDHAGLKIVGLNVKCI
jgi:hypothetical protein